MLLGRGGRRGLEGLDLLLEVLVLLDQLREALLDLVDELVDLQDLVARLAGHPEPLVANIVQRQRHHSPRVCQWSFQVRAATPIRTTVPNLVWATAHVDEVSLSLRRVRRKLRRRCSG